MDARGEADTAADVALKSPGEGDSSPPPSVTLSTPDRKPGTEIRITDLDDLADETIATVDFLVGPRDDLGTMVAVDVTVELADGGITGTDYTLKGRVDLTFPGLVGPSVIAPSAACGQPAEETPITLDTQGNHTRSTLRSR